MSRPQGRGVQAGCLAAVFIFVAGCFSPSVLREPAATPSALPTYSVTTLAGRGADLPVSLNLADCAESAFLTKKGVSGITRIVCPFPVRPIVRREFKRVIQENFLPPANGQRPAVELKVSSRRILLRKDGRIASCDVDLDVELLDPYETKPPYFRRSYQVHSDGTFWSADEVPACVYKAVQDVVRKFLADLNGVPSALPRPQANKNRW